MAVINNFRQDHTLPLFGNGYIVRSWRGKLIVQKWPRKRGKNLAPKVILQNQRFHNANVIAKYADPEQQKRAIELGNQGPLYPRDYITAAMTSGLYIFAFPDGRKMYPMALVQDISNDLDIIAQIPGMILIRGPEVWQPLGPLSENEIIMGQSGNPIPSVAPWPIDFTGLRISDVTKFAQSTSGFATKGWKSTILTDVWVKALVPWYNAISGASYKGTICIMNGNTISSVVATTSTITPGATALRRDYAEFSTIQQLSAGTEYGFFWTRTDSTITTHPGIWRSNVQVQVDFPHGADLAWYRLASTNPLPTQIGSSNTTVDLFSVDIAYTFKV